MYWRINAISYYVKTIWTRECNALHGGVKNSAVRYEKSEEKNGGSSPGLLIGIPDEPECRSLSQFGRTAYLVINCSVWKERARLDAKPDNAGRSRSKCTRQPPQKKGNEMGEWLVVVVTTAFKMRRRAYLDARLSEHRLMHSECSNILEQKKTSPKFPALLIWSNLVAFSKFDRYLNIPFSRASKK